MDVNKIMSADVLDIIFDGRNKEYGAYDLRKTYKKRMTIALIAMIAFCLIFILGSIWANGDKNKNNTIVVQDVQLEDIKQEDKKNEPPPPPPPPAPEPPKVEIARFTPPLIVKDELVKPEDEIKEVKKLEDTKIGTINQEGIKDDGIVTPIVEDKGTGIVEPKKVEEDYDKVFTKVEQPAEFPGGLKEWTRFLERNLNSSIPTDEGAPPGNYTVRVQFIVDKDGNVSQVQALNDPKYGTAEEAVRVIKKGPKWKPAIQNGRKVIYQAVQSITFQVTDGE